ncbi:ATP-grasp domain-containing protein [Rathayibacter toxicus]|uniref:ATP-grasp domain-containing protein n=1 Tax=Rathayibacter toxicus TaxID=145458 RepID=A0A0C5BD38_9MICO|nr:ATP-grasp domain-containing protein [Rathayibacter toxicus]AJM77106.1 hypothetical protein TI83_02290 [Rathayibacter toxicus]ALS57062.1 hypothetical protein APU90_04185 [Rathayibacter toxicus]KKM46113.1 hypothetical protein VT73_03300 [Rathayibacter toxicus]PPG23065.1 ATP-grasp domain-containing protein [Rathayibacter toxicus]PPG47647.1 ATP-grasp domain-containing protein [Rathayibacter toxicus]
MTGLVVLTSDREAAVECALETGAEVSVITAPRYRHLYEHRCPVLEVPALSQVDAVSDAVRALAAKGRADVLLAATEKSIPVAGFVRSIIDIPGLGASDAIAFTSKSAMKQRWKDAGISTAEFRSCATVVEIARAAEEIGYPVVIKPTFGAGGYGTRCVSSRTELDDPHSRAWLTELTAKVGATVERYIPVTTEFHCDSVIREGRVVFSAVSQYFDPLLAIEGRATVGSFVLPIGDERERRVRELNDRAVIALGLRNGVTHCECFDTPQGLVAGEAACRPGGGGVKDTLFGARGVDIWREFLHAEMRTGPRPRARPAADLYGWMFFSAPQHLLAEVRALSSVIAIRPDAPGSATAVIVMRTADEDSMRSVHATIAGVHERWSNDG